MLIQCTRVHLIHDLRPYVCTYKHCETGDHTYDRRRDWAEHEAFTHRRVWRCLSHQDETFPNISLYKAHIRRCHDEDSSTLQTLELMKASQSASSDAHLRPCPFCLATLPSSDKMERHVARHLERIASFALPRSTGLEEDINEQGSVIGSVEAELEDSQSGLSEVEALSDNSSLGIDLSNDNSKFDKGPLTLDSLQASELTSEMPNDSIIRTYFNRLETVQRSSSESSDTTAHTPAKEGESLYDQRDHSDDGNQGQAHSNHVHMAKDSTTPLDTVEDKDDAELSLNDDGTSSPGLSFCLVGVAQFINQNFEPKGTSVIHPDKMQRFYELFKVDGDRLPWRRIFDDRTSSISRIYRELKVEHHLIQEEKLDKRPDIPALTPTGFCTLNCVLLRTLPDVEFSRLQRIIADPIWNSFIRTWPERSTNVLLDAPSLHVARHRHTYLRSGQPQRNQFPAKADEDLKSILFTALINYGNIDPYRYMDSNSRKSVEGALTSMNTGTTVPVPEQGGVTATVSAELIRKITEEVIRQLRKSGSGRQGTQQDLTDPESTKDLETTISTIVAATTAAVDAESSST